LKRERLRLGQEVQRQLARVVKPLWMTAVNSDLRWPTTNGASATLVQKLLRYFDRVLDAAVEDVRVWQAVLEVRSVLKPPLALFQPGIVLRVLAQRAHDH
jgi:hypothetical protein